MHSLRKKAIKSLSWSVIAKLISQGVTFLATIYLAKILGAKDFGLVALSLVYTGFLQNFIDAGFMHALIQRPTITQRELSSCFWLLLVSGGVAFSLSLLLTNSLDIFFNTPGIGQIIVVQSSIFLILPFRTIGQALLSRDVRIDELSRMEVLFNVLRFASSIFMAWKGAGVWSLIIPMAVCEILYSLSCYGIAGWRLTIEFSWRALKPLASFGVNISLSRIVWFAASRVDQLIIGKILGAEALGLYSLAMQFANAIPQFAASTLSRVVFPVFARLQNDVNKMKETYLGVIKYTSLIFLPAFIGIGLVAPDLFSITFKPVWQRAITPLQFLCLLAFLKLIESISGFLLNARGRSKLNFIINLIALLTTSVGVYLGAHYWNLNVAAFLVTLSFVPIVMMTSIMALRELGGDVRDLVAGFKQPLLGILVMTVVVIFTKALINDGLHVTRVIVMMLSGILVYGTVIHYLSPELIRNIKKNLPNYKSI